MWVAGPYYSAYHDSRQRATPASNKKDGSSTSATQSDLDSLQPAVDGPPSPEVLRYLRNQMLKEEKKKEKKAKKSSAFSTHRNHHQQKHQHQPAPSSSSAHASSSDRLPWDQVLDNISLSRKSSARSTSSSMPSRESRPDSVQLLGKAIFGKKARLRRESSANSSSGSSLYSAEMTLDGVPPPGARDHLIPTIFGRRKAAKSEPFRDAARPVSTSRNAPISVPYNFQHVAHTRRDHLPTLQGGASRVENVAEFSALQSTPQQPVNVGAMSTSNAYSGPPYADEIHYEDFAYEAPHPGPRRLVKSSKSQENLRAIPPRPPRPPRSPIIEVQESDAPPIPPPRLSSRQSIRYGGSFEPPESTPYLDRPLTSGGIGQPGDFHHYATDLAEPPATSHGFASPAEHEMLPDSYYPAGLATHDDESWPLTPSAMPGSPPPDAILPGVPEEEEPVTRTHRSRSSVLSTSSSIRRSQSVPQLRQVTQSHPPASRRPPSSGSDTLGRFDLFAAQRALRAAGQGDADVALHRSSWEDDIDYCYEHEVEADCSYEWTRPSLETYRDDQSFTPSCLSPSESRTDLGHEVSPEPGSAPFLAPDQFDLPALSPASHTSINDTEAITPTALAGPVTSNFSLPRADGGLRVHRSRADSRASSFKESHGFTLSPSLLIPADFQQAMMLSGRDTVHFNDSGAIFVEDYSGFDKKVTAASHRPLIDRVSTSSVGTDSTGRSASSNDDRHESVSTAFTRLTAASLSAENLGLEGGMSPRSEGGGRFKQRDSGSDNDECAFVEQLIPGFTPNLDTEFGSEIGDLVPEPQRKPSRKLGRSRAQTTSLSNPAARAGQFRLFPRSGSISRI